MIMRMAPLLSVAGAVLASILCVGALFNFVGSERSYCGQDALQAIRFLSTTVPVLLMPLGVLWFGSWFFGAAGIALRITRLSMAVALGVWVASYWLVHNGTSFI
jgi:hypothetical protein